ncbi:ABC transporter permease [Calidifontibacillus oryziterrae]|uniref:ABC transporter permease n=1 Tax=Calidifontibacillus oryziterrae TaxID=1191699 RepID=UPI00030CBB86|nr:ABC transporter permease [Calidifontibacillus oryziterrae]
MDMIIKGVLEAFRMLVTFDPEIYKITWLTLKVSGSATFISLLIGIPIGVILAWVSFPGRRIIMSFVNTAMGFPPVVVGLWVFLLLARNGPLGDLDLIYTPTAILIAQAVIASPIIMGLTSAAIMQVDDKMRMQMKALGATKLQMLFLALREARFSLLAAVIAGFGAVVSEVGASQMVGGNIKGYSRVLTTATVMEVSKGNTDIAIGISVILMLLAYLVTLTLTLFQQKDARG